MSLLAAHGLGFAYGAREVLRDVGIEIAAGELVGLIGPNGSGKTTLVRCLAGLGVPHAGRVLLDGAPLGARTRREKARAIAFVPQDPRVEFPFTALEVVLMGRAPYLSGLAFAGPEDLALAHAALARLDLDGVDPRRLDTLSGGERQRVFLARALVQAPRVLLLDEPTTHLDLRHQAGILDVVRERVRGGGLAALAVLHDLNLAAVACDRLVLLVEGRIVAAGSPEAVLTKIAIESAFGARVHVAWHETAGVPAILPAKT